MSITPGWTDDEIREVVWEYERLPHGTKAQWVRDQDLSDHQLRRWREAVYSGDLDRGLIPRDTKGMTTSQERRKIANQESARAAKIEKLEARVRELEQVNEALGKAIGLLHQLNEQEPEPPQAVKPSSSSFKKTRSSDT